MITIEVVNIAKGNGDTKKARVLVEFDKGTRQYAILKFAQAKGVSISGTLKSDVEALLEEFAGAIGFEDEDD